MSAPLICPQCQAPNRANAKFCNQCASLLAPLYAETVVMDYRPKRRRRSSSRARADVSDARPARSKSASWRPLALLVLLAVLTGAATTWFFAQRQQNASPPEPVLAQARTPAPQTPHPAAEAPPAPAAPPAPSAEPALTEPAPATPPAETPSAPTATPAPAPAATPRAPRPRSVAAAPTPAPKPTPIPATPPAPTPAAAAPRAPAQVCAKHNFLAYAACMQEQCSRPGMKSHPQCVRIREREQALRQGSGGG